MNRPSNTYTPCEEQQLSALRMLAGRPDGATALTLFAKLYKIAHLAKACR